MEENGFESMLDSAFDRAKLATDLHGPIKSTHELYGLLHEETFEVFDAIRGNASEGPIITELYDVITVCLRGIAMLSK